MCDCRTEISSFKTAAAHPSGAAARAMIAAAACPLLSALIWTLASVSSLSLSYPPSLTGAPAASSSSASSPSFTVKIQAFSGVPKPLEQKGRSLTPGISSTRGAAAELPFLHPDQSSNGTGKCLFEGVICGSSFTFVLPIRPVTALLTELVNKETSSTHSQHCLPAHQRWPQRQRHCSRQQRPPAAALHPSLLRWQCLAPRESIGLLNCCLWLSRCSLQNHALLWGFPSYAQPWCTVNAQLLPRLMIPCPAHHASAPQLGSSQHQEVSRSAQALISSHRAIHLDIAALLNYIL